MPTKTKSTTKTKTTASPLAADLLFGAQAIADEIGASLRRTFHLLEGGHLPADKCGRTWVSTRTRLRRFFQGGAS
jgi:hypothetical protein